MRESPRPEDLGEQRTPVAPEPADESSSADPRSEPGVTGAAARVPYWFIVIAVIVVALIALYFAGIIFPPE
jgi:hypothetical protein